MLETAARRIPEPGHSIPQALRATNVGRYHIERLCMLFSYIEAIIIDTPIFDENLRDSIHNERHISGRLNKVNTFCEYLDKCWNKHFYKKQVWFNWEKVSIKIKKQITTIRNKVENY